MYVPELAPVAGNLMWSALFGTLPLLTVFITLGALRWKAHYAGLAGLAVALAVAVLCYDMPVDLAALSATQGLAFGLFPIMWIVISAIWLYELTVTSGRFEDLRLVIDRISDDPRIQAIIIAFCFGGLLEALAGFGAPVAITGVMLMAVGFTALRAAAVVLLANTAPVAFGAIALPILTAGKLTGIDYRDIGAQIGHQTPLLAVFVPAFLVFLADGKRGLRDVWPIAAVVGVAFGITQWFASTFVSVELTDILASLVGLAVTVTVLRFWRPQGTAEATERLLTARRAEIAEGRVNVVGGGADDGVVAVRERAPEGSIGARRTFLALFPYLVVVAAFTVTKLIDPINKAMAGTDLRFGWPGLDGKVASASGKVSSSTVFTLSWLSSPGTVLLLCGVVVAVVYRISPARAAAVWWTNLVRMRWAILTVMLVLGLAYVMNQSGQTITIGTWIAGAGAAFAFFSPVLGWLGTAVTGSDTSANALFATLQQAAGQTTGISPTLLVAANTSGGVVGKMISPQNLAIAATAVGMVGREAEIFRKVIWWSLGLLVALCLLVGLQSQLTWMVVA
ncbi:L-lactate permease [Tsukamurella spumae]|uniref:L-lactate permease n=2 Tax=Tsukamurella spumae TaxID=44753 RepID=A0A846XA52_9ACTN|nr:L-lactate permease [Tsukamurella spumae]